MFRLKTLHIKKLVSNVHVFLMENIHSLVVWLISGIPSNLYCSRGKLEFFDRFSIPAFFVVQSYVLAKSWTHIML